MEMWQIYHENIPQFLLDAAQTPLMQRLQHVGMNCGCEYTGMPMFRSGRTYSRFIHSMGVGLIVWHFTGDMTQALAGLLHDVATPVFAHVVDFLNGDYMTQESTEDGTEKLILQSPELCEVLDKYGIAAEAVVDYHRYPIADNPSPRLSADRLEYTLTNGVNFGKITVQQAKQLYDSIAVGANESGHPELIFGREELAEKFAVTALACGKVYVSDEDRYAMQILAELLHSAMGQGILSAEDLCGREADVIGKLEASSLAADWQAFCQMQGVRSAAMPEQTGAWRRLNAKRRYIDPYVAHKGRTSACSAAFAAQLKAYLDDPMDGWLCGF